MKSIICLQSEHTEARVEPIFLWNRDIIGGIQEAKKGYPTLDATKEDQNMI